MSDKECWFCGKPADGVWMGQVDMCVDCLFDNPEAEKYYKKHLEEIHQRLNEGAEAKSSIETKVREDLNKFSTYREIKQEEIAHDLALEKAEEEAKKAKEEKKTQKKPSPKAQVEEFKL